MSLCASCGAQIPGDAGLCPHHECADNKWAVVNRIMCDFLHRKREPERLKEEERRDDFWVSTSEAI